MLGANSPVSSFPPSCYSMMLKILPCPFRCRRILSYLTGTCRTRCCVWSRWCYSCVLNTPTIPPLRDGDLHLPASRNTYRNPNIPRLCFPPPLCIGEPPRSKCDSVGQPHVRPANPFTRPPRRLRNYNTPSNSGWMACLMQGAVGQHLS